MSKKDGLMPETKNVRKVFMLWQDEDEEKWLNEMSLQGWHLNKVKPNILRKTLYRIALYRLLTYT